ncbi:hypothetical protein B0H21DRAFT_732747 [Amylocystis lapponica]|nr:hypothetical protein B0H21DRAFT_732747 [Amylocystis lapponica]
MTPSSPAPTLCLCPCENDSSAPRSSGACSAAIPTVFMLSASNCSLRFLLYADAPFTAASSSDSRMALARDCTGKAVYLACAVSAWSFWLSLLSHHCFYDGCIHSRGGVFVTQPTHVRFMDLPIGKIVSNFSHGEADDDDGVYADSFFVDKNETANDSSATTETTPTVSGAEGY